MNESPRSGFESARKISLQEDSDDGLMLEATPAERIAMVWPMTRDCWAFVQDPDKNVEREFQRHIENVRRGRG